MFGRRKKNKSLSGIQILLVDGDPYMAKAVTKNLNAMGFKSVDHVANGKAALESLALRPADILITEWTMEEMNGLELVKHIRRTEDCAMHGLPIVMLTGKGERGDVEEARDAGITEFVIKPFSSHTLFSRIEQLVEAPRAMLFTAHFVGPDRRRKSRPPGDKERRVAEPKAIPFGKVSVDDDYYTPRIMPPDLSLKNKVGEPLANIITPNVLDEAQRAIDSLKGEAQAWIREDLVKLDKAFAELLTQASATAIENLKAPALSIKSRAGTFHYGLASDVARLLYLFLCTDFNPSREGHKKAVHKHIQALKVIFGTKLELDGGPKGKLLLHELDSMLHSMRA